jgi:hypothetical protein
MAADVHESHVRNGVKVSVAGFKRGLIRDWYVMVSEDSTDARREIKMIILRSEDQARLVANAAFKATATSSDIEVVHQAAHDVAGGASA